MILGSGATRAQKRYRSLTRLLIEKLKEAIVKGKLIPGEPLAEAQLASSLKVGPAALREALRALEAEGYVTFRLDNEVVVRNRGILRNRRRARGIGRPARRGTRTAGRDRALARIAPGAQGSLPEAGCGSLL